MPPRVAPLPKPKAHELAGLILYLLTLTLAMACALVRVLVVGPPLILAGYLLWHTTAFGDTAAMLVGFAPLVLSIVALAWPAGAGWWWRQTSGGRPPSRRETATYEEALATLQDTNPGLRGPRHWFVLDEPDVNAAAFADTLSFNRATLEGEYVEAILAHELGHLDTSDARLSTAVYRLVVLPQLLSTRRPLGLIGGLAYGVWFVASGAAALRIMNPLWGSYWRSREFAADLYAAKLGQAAAAADFLEADVLLYDRPVPLIWMTTVSHPYTELRIDRLREYAEDEQPPTDAEHQPPTPATLVARGETQGDVSPAI